MPDKYKYLLLGVVLGVAIFFLLDNFLLVIQKEEQPISIKQPIPKANNQLITGYEVPEYISFAEEEVPLSRPEIRERLEREIMVNAFWHSNSVILIKRANKWLPTIDSILKVHGVPTDFKYLAVAESGLDNVVSPSKAVGFWQFLKGTAKDFGLVVNKDVDQRYDPILATVASTKYLKQSHEKFGSWTTVAASYNLGMNATQKILDKQRPDTYYDMIMSEEPSRYVFRILALKNLLERPLVYGFDIPHEELYTLPQTRSLQVSEDIPDLHSFAADHGTSYTTMRRLNPWIRSYQLNVPAGQSFEIQLPIQ